MNYGRKTTVNDEQRTMNHEQKYTGNEDHSSLYLVVRGSLFIVHCLILNLKVGFLLHGRSFQTQSTARLTVQLLSDSQRTHLL